MPRVSLGVIVLAAVTLALWPALSSAAVPALGGQPYTVTGVVVTVRGTILTLRLDAGGTSTFRLIVPGLQADRVTPGTRVQAWILPVADGLPLVLRLTPLGGFAPLRPLVDVEPGALRGLILARGNGHLTLLGERNVLYTVLVTGTTLIRGGELVRAAIVQVVGSRNSDGSVSARSITVQFDPKGAVRAAGRITILWRPAGFILSSGTVVGLQEDTWILRGSARGDPGTLTPGVSVVVLGVGVPPYLSARVIEISL